jgi:hypothetical protein
MHAAGLVDYSDMSLCRFSMRYWHSCIRVALFLVCALLAQPCGKAAADEITSRGVLADALAAANRIDDSGLKAQTLDQIASVQAKTGDIAGARQTADAITVDRSGDSTGAQTEAGWKNDAYAEIASAQAGAGDFAGASATVRGIDDDDTKALAFQYIAQELARKGNIPAAKAYAAHLDGASRTRADGAIAEAEATAGDIGAAKEMAKGLDDEKEQALTLAFIAEAQAKHGDQSGAQETVNLAKSAAVQVPDYLSRTVLGTVAAAEVKAGDLAGAEALLKVNPSYIAREIAIARGQTGDIAGAKEMFAQISDPTDQACANAGIAEAQSRAGDGSGAVESLNAARMAAGSISDSSRLADACAYIVEAWTKAGDASAAADWARSQQDPSVEVTGLISVARTLGNSEVSSNQ